MFRMDVAKVNRDVAYVAMVVYICCKLMFLIFYLFLPDVCCKYVYLNVAYFTHICCKYFIWMLCIFYNDFHVFQMHVSNVSSTFRRMLQVLHLNVSKLDRVLHLPLRFVLPRLGVLSCSWCRLASTAPSLSFRCW